MKLAQFVRKQWHAEDPDLLQCDAMTLGYLLAEIRKQLKNFQSVVKQPTDTGTYQTTYPLQNGVEDS